MRVKHIDIGTEFAPNLGPRYRSDGPYSGQQFREELLEPAFSTSDLVIIELDSIDGYTPSFLEEAFGGLVRKYRLPEARKRLRFDAVHRAYLIPVIEGYMQDAELELQQAGRE